MSLTARTECRKRSRLLVNRGILYILQVFIHCSLVAWDPNGLGNTKKACHYIKDYG